MTLIFMCIFAKSHTVCCELTVLAWTHWKTVTVSYTLWMKVLPAHRHCPPNKVLVWAYSRLAPHTESSSLHQSYLQPLVLPWQIFHVQNAGDWCHGAFCSIKVSNSIYLNVFVVHNFVCSIILQPLFFFSCSGKGCYLDWNPIQFRHLFRMQRETICKEDLV